jgi:hypothetical protein
LNNYSERLRRRLRRHRELSAERRLREKRVRKNIRKGIRRQKRTQIPFLVVQAPPALDFEENYENTIRFLEQVRRTSAAGGHTMLIWMRRCQSMSPEVALVLAAEIERCLYHRPRSINGNDPKSGAIAAMLRDIGFHNLLHFNEPKVKVPEVGEATTYLKMKSGVQGGGNHADDLRGLVLGNAASTSDELRDELVRSLNEAVLNVHQHAYDDDIENTYTPMPNKRWWIAGYRDAVTKEIGFIAFDQGVGIPATMPRKHAEFVRDLMAAAGQLLRLSAPTNDHQLIKRAFELGRSRTENSGQGKGLNDFKVFLAAAGGKGSLRVLSGRGSYLYYLDGTERVEPLSAPFHGTLIVWRLTDSPAVQWENGS